VGLDVQYARSGGIAIAYQVVGEGDIDLVFVPDYVSNLVYDWEWRRYRDFFDRLAQSFRLIRFDKRGTGLSDHGGNFAALETRMDDLRAVLDGAGSTSAVVLSAHEGSAMAVLYAATTPSAWVRSCCSIPARISLPTIRALSKPWRISATAGAHALTATSFCKTAVLPCTPRKRTARRSPTTCASARAPRSHMPSTAPSSRRI